ncbi:hypothetical protein [Dokdonia donghaensis]|uniref:Lipoprotein n=1 Tax=Dokdonia donghaensis DSW-1 TaxID=1300343 RepID=A0A0A2GQ60_9FLAO|nr:hypothetical protein [Dokdonia donghaensis]KGO05394.1 hypothetical protein NV36_00065 [Dokdonia donghaensis DSW-1]
MRKILSLVILIAFFSCKNSEKENNLNQKETELTQKENDLESKTKELEVKEQILKLNSEVKNNIIHCENKKFTIKVDNLKNGDLRYISWNKPKSTSDEPNLILYDGKVERQGTGGGFHYIFKSGEWNYIIENNFMGETAESMGIFLKLLNNGKQKLYSKMTDLTTEKDYDLKSYSKSNLIGNWWTSNYAVRKVRFNENGTFLFENGEGKSFKGTFEMYNKSVNLKFNNGLDKVLKIGGGYDNTSLTLTGGGENFVKEWKE